MEQELFFKLIESGDLKDVYDLVENFPALVHIKKVTGETGLHMAIIRKNILLSCYLIGMCSNVNSQDNDGNTPLIIASFIQNVELVKTLLLFGGNPNIKNNKYKSAIDFSRTKEISLLLS